MRISIRQGAAWLGQAMAFASAAATAQGLLSIDNPAAIGPASGTYAVMDGFQGSDSVSIREFFGDWQGSYTPRAGNNLGLLTLRSEAGVQWSGTRLGALYRAQVLVQANRDTTDLVRQYNTSSGYDAARSYQLDYRLTGFAAKGLRLSKSLPLSSGDTWKLRGGLGAAALTGTQLKLETASGSAIALNAQDFSAAASMESSNSTLNTQDASLFNPLVQRPQAFGGEGYALDAGISMERADGLQIDVAINDLAGQMEWKNIPSRVTQYSTANKYYDAAGYVHFNPTATARSSYVNYSQTLDPKLWLALTYPSAGYELQAATSYIADLWLPEFNLSRPLAPKWRIKSGYELRFGTVVLALQHPWFELSLRSDTLDLGRAKGYGLRLACAIPF